MIEVNLIVNDQEIELAEPVTIVSGSENVYLCKFTFTEEWTGFEKTAVFLSRTDAREVYMSNNQCTIPWEALEIDDIRRQELKIGVYGVKNDVRMPTVYTKPLTVHPGAETAEGGGTPTPTQWEEIMEMLADGTIYADATLTKAGFAADSKTVGDNFAKTIKYRGILNPSATPPITPDTVTDIGYWTCNSSNTQTFIGSVSSSVFLNLKQGTNDFIQMFITFRGEVYGRYNKTGDFFSFSDFIRGDLSNPDTTTAPGFYRSVATTTQQHTGENVTASFLNATTDAGTVFLQAFIMANGKIYTRYGNSGSFVTLADATLTKAGFAADSKTVGDNFAETIKYRGTLNPSATPPITPDTVTDIGYWTCNSSNTQTFIGSVSSSVFLNLKQGTNDFIQLFITFRGEVYGRYNKTGDFLSFSDFTRGDLSNPDTTTAPGFYKSTATVTQQYTGENVDASFLNATTDAGAVLIQAFILPNGKIYSRYGNAGNFVTLEVPKRQTVFDPEHELIVSSSGGFLTVTIPAGFYAVPENTLGIYTLSEDIIITQTNTTVYQYGVFNLTSKIGRLAERRDTLASDDLVLFAFYGTDVDNISVTPQKFPQKASENARTKTMNDFFAPMFNRVGTPFKIVLGGDSITHGVGGTGFAQDGDIIVDNYKRNPNGYCWANLFKSYIEDNYNATVINNGVTGTYSWWWNIKKSTLIPSDTDLFILTLGTNNRIKIEDRSGTTHDEQISNYYTQMKSIIEFCNTIGVPILLCSSIPATATNENRVEDSVPVYPSHVYEFNGVLQKLASEFNMEYFNLYDAAYYYVKDHNLSLDTLLPDGLHPGDEMYRIMFYLYLRGFNLAPSYVDVQLPE